MFNTYCIAICFRMAMSLLARKSSKPASRFRKLSLCTIATLSSPNPTLALLPLSSPILRKATTDTSHQVYRQMASTGTSESATTKTKCLSPRILETLDPCVVLMKQLIGQYAHLWETEGGIFSLAQGVVYWEPPSSCQEALLEEITKKGGNLLHTYGPARGIPELTEALQEKIGSENGLANHDVMVTVGANQAFVNCVLTTLCDDSKAIVFAPYYFNHVMALQMCCGDDSVVVGPTSSEGIPDLVWLEGTLKTKSIDMVTIVNPGNPTGVSLPRSFLQQVADLCEQYSAWLVLDCAYEYFTSPEGHQPIATFPDAPHVIHIFSLSKSYSLAGYRCGYLVLHKDARRVVTTRSSSSSSGGGSSSSTTTTTITGYDGSSSPSLLITNMLKVQDTLPIAPPRISQIAALGALKAGKEWVREKYATLDASRQLILDALQPLEIMGGSGAMYIMAKLPFGDDDKGNTAAVDDVEVCRRLVEDHGIAIIPGTYCGFPGWIRVCYANLPLDKCQIAARRLQTGIHQVVFQN